MNGCKLGGKSTLHTNQSAVNTCNDLVTGRQGGDGGGRLNAVGEAPGCVPFPHLTAQNRGGSYQCEFIFLFLFIIGLLDGRRITSRGLAEIRLPFFSSSDKSGEGGGVAF